MKGLLFACNLLQTKQGDEAEEIRLSHAVLLQSVRVVRQEGSAAAGCGGGVERQPDEQHDLRPVTPTDHTPFWLEINVKSTVTGGSGGDDQLVTMMPLLPPVHVESASQAVYSLNGTIVMPEQAIVIKGTYRALSLAFYGTVTGEGGGPPLPVQPTHWLPPPLPRRPPTMTEASTITTRRRRSSSIDVDGAIRARSLVRRARGEEEEQQRKRSSREGEGVKDPGFRVRVSRLKAVQEKLTLVSEALTSGQGGEGEESTLQAKEEALEHLIQAVERCWDDDDGDADQEDTAHREHAEDEEERLEPPDALVVNLVECALATSSWVRPDVPSSLLLSPEDECSHAMKLGGGALRLAASLCRHPLVAKAFFASEGGYTLLSILQDPGSSPPWRAQALQAYWNATQDVKLLADFCEEGQSDELEGSCSAYQSLLVLLSRPQHSPVVMRLGRRLLLRCALYRAVTRITTLAGEAMKRRGGLDFTDSIQGFKDLEEQQQPATEKPRGSSSPSSLPVRLALAMAELSGLILQESSADEHDAAGVKMAHGRRQQESSTSSPPRALSLAVVRLLHSSGFLPALVVSTALVAKGAGATNHAPLASEIRHLLLVLLRLEGSEALWLEDLSATQTLLGLLEPFTTPSSKQPPAPPSPSLLPLSFLEDGAPSWLGGTTASASLRARLEALSALGSVASVAVVHPHHHGEDGDDDKDGQEDKSPTATWRQVEAWRGLYCLCVRSRQGAEAVARVMTQYGMDLLLRGLRTPWSTDPGPFLVSYAVGVLEALMRQDCRGVTRAIGARGQDILQAFDAASRGGEGSEEEAAVCEATLAAVTKAREELQPVLLRQPGTSCSGLITHLKRLVAQIQRPLAGDFSSVMSSKGIMATMMGGDIVTEEDKQDVLSELLMVLRLLSFEAATPHHLLHHKAAAEDGGGGPHLLTLLRDTLAALAFSITPPVCRRGMDAEEMVKELAMDSRRFLLVAHGGVARAESLDRHVKAAEVGVAVMRLVKDLLLFEAAGRCKAGQHPPPWQAEGIVQAALDLHDGLAASEATGRTSPSTLSQLVSHYRRLLASTLSPWLPPRGPWAAKYKQRTSSSSSYPVLLDIYTRTLSTPLGHVSGPRLLLALLPPPLPVPMDQASGVDTIGSNSSTVEEWLDRQAVSERQLRQAWDTALVEAEGGEEEGGGGPGLVKIIRTLVDSAVPGLRRLARDLASRAVHLGPKMGAAVVGGVLVHGVRHGVEEVLARDLGQEAEGHKLAAIEGLERRVALLNSLVNKQGGGPAAILLLLQHDAIGVLSSTLLLRSPRLCRLSLSCLLALCDPHRLHDDHDLLAKPAGFLGRVAIDAQAVTVPCKDAVLAHLRRSLPSLATCLKRSVLRWPDGASASGSSSIDPAIVDPAVRLLVAVGEVCGSKAMIAEIPGPKKSEPVWSPAVFLSRALGCATAAMASLGEHLEHKYVMMLANSSTKTPSPKDEAAERVYALVEARLVALLGSSLLLLSLPSLTASMSSSSSRRYKAFFKERGAAPLPLRAFFTTLSQLEDHYTVLTSALTTNQSATHKCFPVTAGGFDLAGLLSMGRLLEAVRGKETEISDLQAGLSEKKDDDDDEHTQSADAATDEQVIQQMESATTSWFEDRRPAVNLLVTTGGAGSSGMSWWGRTRDPLDKIRDDDDDRLPGRPVRGTLTLVNDKRKKRLRDEQEQHQQAQRLKGGPRSLRAGSSRPSSLHVDDFMAASAREEEGRDPPGTPPLHSVMMEDGPWKQQQHAGVPPSVPHPPPPRPAAPFDPRVGPSDPRQGGGGGGGPSQPGQQQQQAPSPRPTPPADAGSMAGGGGLPPPPPRGPPHMMMMMRGPPPPTDGMSERRPDHFPQQQGGRPTFPPAGGMGEGGGPPFVRGDGRGPGMMMMHHPRGGPPRHDPRMHGNNNMHHHHHHDHHGPPPPGGGYGGPRGPPFSGGGGGGGEGPPPSRFSPQPPQQQQHPQDPRGRGVGGRGPPPPRHQQPPPPREQHRW